MLKQKALTKNLTATLCTTSNTLFVHNNKTVQKAAFVYTQNAQKVVRNLNAQQQAALPRSAVRGLAAQRRRPRPPRERAAPREREGLELAAAVQADGQHRQVPARVSRARRRAHGPVRDARPLPRA